MNIEKNYNGKLPADLAKTLAFPRSDMPEKYSIPVKGYDFTKCVDGVVNFDEMLSEASLSTGLQSTSFGMAVDITKSMIEAKLNKEPLAGEHLQKQNSISDHWKPTPCTIFLGYTSNIVSSGTREIVRYLAQHRMVDCMVTSAGGIEEDFMKCFTPHKVGEFHVDDRDLFSRSINRNGNILLETESYSRFEDWLIPILDQMLKEEHEEGQNWTPSKVIRRLGKEIDNEDSVYYWAYKNNIPVFCPALTDGGLGDALFCHSFKHDGASIKMDIVDDLRSLNLIALRAVKSGLLILGGGVSKHQILNAHSLRDGAEFAVIINTAQEFDGCDSGARPEEGLSWGKIRKDAKFVKVFAEASLILPLLVSQTFFKYESNFGQIM